MSAGLLTPVLNVDKLTLTEGDDVTAVCTAKGETGFLTFVFRDGPEELCRKDTFSQKAEHNLTVTKKHENMFCYYTIKLSDSLERSNNSNLISIDFQGRSLMFLFIYLVINGLIIKLIFSSRK